MPSFVIDGLVLAALVAVLGWVVWRRPRPDPLQPATRAPDLFPNDSTDFARSSMLAPESSSLEQRVRTGRRPRAPQWNTQVLEDIEWHRFEMLCDELLGHDEAAVRRQQWHGKPPQADELRE